jgi:formylglycine-generating enzyme required for sulfatase activity
MVEVTGDYCPAPEQICDEYISEKRDRCVRFRPKVRCVGTPSSKHFCVDRYEYPNEAGKLPTVSVTWDEARDLCANEGKRLCAAEEWTLACEGPQMKPYPFGYTRDSTACNIDKPYILPDNAAYDSTRTRAEEVARVSQSEPSGSREHCVSDYGVHDMTGNVDEWVVNEHGTLQGPEFQSGLKGGYWGPVRNRCRPTTTDHNHWHHGYQIGFRCCKDPAQLGPTPDAAIRDVAPGGGRDGWESPEATEPSRS